MVEYMIMLGFKGGSKEHEPYRDPEHPNYRFKYPEDAANAVLRIAKEYFEDRHNPVDEIHIIQVNN